MINDILLEFILQNLIYFASLGYIVESSGGPEVLCISDVLASGSFRGFLAGKHFNRCKRLHPLFATALEILHFHGFIEKHGWMTDDIMALLHELGGNVCMESLSAIL